MRMPAESAAGEKLVDRPGTYHVAAVSADPETAPIAAGFQKVQDVLRVANEAERASDREEMMAPARRQVADTAMDRAIRRLDLNLQVAVNKDTASPRYRRIFPNGITPIVTAPVEDEIRLVKSIEALLVESPEGSVERKAVSEVRSARQALEKAKGEHDRTIETHGTAYARERAAKLEWLRQYRVDYAHILGLFPGDRSRVESYFLRSRSRDEDEPAEPPATTV